jgi:hypothetical protein
MSPPTNRRAYVERRVRVMGCASVSVATGIFISSVQPGWSRRSAWSSGRWSSAWFRVGAIVVLVVGTVTLVFGVSEFSNVRVEVSGWHFISLGVVELALRRPWTTSTGTMSWMKRSSRQLVDVHVLDDSVPTDEPRLRAAHGTADGLAKAQLSRPSCYLFGIVPVRGV